MENGFVERGNGAMAGLAPARDVDVVACLERTADVAERHHWPLVTVRVMFFTMIAQINDQCIVHLSRVIYSRPIFQNILESAISNITMG